MASSSSSSSTSQWVYDVFLSFRGEDTRRNFVAHLNAALSNAEINTYIDDRIQKGTDLEPELFRAIEDSRISIVVFSENYVHSSWCLKELEQIMKCRVNCGQIVEPVFYHVEPSVLRHQAGDFGKALEETAKRSSSEGEKMNTVLSTWQIALTEVANISGWDTKNFKDDVELISQIVKDIKRKLNNRLLNITEFPVGLDTHVQQIIAFIKNQSSKVCLIGIWGMGGSGKTTTATAFYNQFHGKFVVHRFIENIREVCEKEGRGNIHLKQQLLLDNMKSIEKRFMREKALVVLDDVSALEQVNALCGKRKCFGTGSVLIVTSRDVRILKLLEVDHVYSMTEMDEYESLELFNLHAFRKSSAKEDFNQLSRSIIDYCGGLPLALEEIGSYLFDRTKQQWKSTLSNLRRIPNDKVQKKLKISYDGLDCDSERGIFLDICCFFIGKKRAYVSEILDGCGLNADMGITILIERSLLKVEKNDKLGMHGLLRDMGREIVCKRSEEELGKRSRLWSDEDVHDVLNQNCGTKFVEGLVLKSQSTENVSFNADSFKKMNNLRLLQLDHVDLTGDFYQENLAVFELKHSNIKLVWNETKLMNKLKILNLSHSKHLTSTPDFSKLPLLEKLIMKNCPNLSKLHHSIGDLKNILLLNLKDCTSLASLPEVIYQLKSLKTLIFSGCSKIDKLEEDIVQMESLTTLIAKDTGVKEMPYSILGLKGIAYISLCGCEGLSFEVLPSVIWSCVPPTMNSSPRISPFDNQYDVDFTESETSQISNLPLRPLLIGIGSCHIVIDILSRSISQGLTSNDSGHFSLPVGDNYPSWLAYRCDGPSTQFHVPENIDCHLKGIILCVVYSSAPENMGAECLISVLIVNYTKFTIQIYKRGTLRSFNDEDWKNVTSNLGPGDKVEIFVLFGCGLIVKETAVYLLYGQSITTEFEQSIFMEVEPSTNMEMEPSAELNVQPSPKVSMQPSPNVKVEALITMEIEQSITVEVESLTNMEMKTSEEVNLQQSIKVDAEASITMEIEQSITMEVESSTIVEMVPLAEVNVRPPPEVDMQPSPKPNNSSFTRLAKRIGACLCFKPPELKV